ncbi:GDSL-type esterase/lipase family protein [Paraburkholderia sediminicola]|uniref:GDSL-type esterase/lipase family protein n=1 Tax=Paraburkholderia metrosideri TaxID=580937 RepID=A0ABW9DSD3_9BURK
MSDASPVVGMVDQLDSHGSGPTEDEIRFVHAYVAPGPLDPELLARAHDPAVLAARDVRVEALRARDWPNLGQYRDANRMLAGISPKAVFIGDSLTEFWLAGDPEMFRYGLVSGGLVNRGISGQTSPQILLRFMADVIQLKPAVVHLLCGGNDLAGNTGPTTFADYQNNIVAMVMLARAFNVKVILGSVTPAGFFAWRPGIDPRARITEINAWFKGLADEHGLIFADYHSALAAPDGSLRAELTRDGVHPTAAGYEVMRPIAIAALAAAAE